MIIFDMDGTLWNALDATLESSHKIVKKYNLEFNDDAVFSGMGKNFIENVHNYFPNLSYEEGSKYLEELNNESMRIINEKGVTIYDGVNDIIKQLSKNYKLGIVTNNNNKYVELFLHKAGLEDYISDYIGTAPLGITKGEAIRKIANRNGESHNCYVGDVKGDMLASEYAHVDFIHARYGFDPKLECIYHIDDIKELPVLINKLYK